MTGNTMSTPLIRHESPFTGTAIQGARGPHPGAAGSREWQSKAITSARPVFVINVGGWQVEVESPDAAGELDFVTYYPDSIIDTVRSHVPLAARQPTYSTLHPDNLESWAQP
jgi:hypothetical protein